MQAAPMPWNTRAAISSGSVSAGRAGDRADREQRQAGDVDALVPDPIAKRGQRQQQHRDRQLIAVDHPHRADGDAPSSRAMTGSATLAIAPSSTAIASASQIPAADQ